MKLEQSETSKFSTIPVSPIMSTLDAECGRDMMALKDDISQTTIGN